MIRFLFLGHRTMIVQPSSIGLLPFRFNHCQSRGVFAENLVGSGFLAADFLHKINPNPRKNHLPWEKVAHAPLFNLFFLGLGLALG